MNITDLSAWEVAALEKGLESAVNTGLVERYCGIALLEKLREMKPDDCLVYSHRVR